MTFHHRNIETGAGPRAAPPDDPVALATRAVGELREAVETRATALETRQAEDICALTARVEPVPVDEVRALRVADDTVGGCLAPDQFRECGQDG